MPEDVFACLSAGTIMIDKIIRSLEAFERIEVLKRDLHSILNAKLLLFPRMSNLR